MKTKFIISCLLLINISTKGIAHESNEQHSWIEDVSVAEDLMREHGILNRIMLIFDEISLRIEENKNFPAVALEKSTQILRELIEDHHEILEENYIFPKFEEKGVLVDLVKTLREQHKKGRELTDYILANASEKHLQNPEIKGTIKNKLDTFVAMYRPHEAREDTVLFPAFKTLVTENEYKELSELFEEMEHNEAGENSFEKAVVEIAEIENILGIFDINQYTP